MKKGLILILVVSFVLSLAGTALAFPLDVNGDFRLRGISYDDGINNIDAKASFWQLRGRINFQGKVDNDTAFFARFGVRNSFGQSNNTFNEIDQYGVKIATDNWKFSIGRQAVSLGQGLILGTGSDVEWDNKFDGLVATTKMGAADFKIIAGKTNATPIAIANGGKPTQWYAAELGGKLGDNMTVGFAYAHSKDDAPSVALNTWGLNAIFTPSPNFAINAEYAKSNADVYNRAYLLGATYKWDKDSFLVQYQKVEKNAVNNFGGAYTYFSFPFNGAGMALGNDWKGFLYIYNHPMTKAASLHLVYLDVKTAGYVGNDKEACVGVVWSF